MSKIVENLESMLARGQDSALLRFSLGNAYLNAAEPHKAALHLRVAVRQDPKYSAAWKLLGKALSEDQEIAGAIDAYRTGIEVAESRGDIQAAKEMKVFLKRLEKLSGSI